MLFLVLLADRCQHHGPSLAEITGQPVERLTTR
jgi:hypothetical protein